jgi:hypothetical protein
MIERQIDKPIPIPPAFVVKKGSKMCSAIAGSSSARSLHRNQDTVWCFAPRADPKPARAIGDGAHRFHPVHDQIEDNLLQLNPVTNRDGRRFCQFGSDNDLANAQLGVHDRECFAEQVIDIDPGSFRRRFI